MPPHQRYGPRRGYVDLEGRRIDIRAGIHTIAGYSAHADQRNLVRFITHMRHWPAEVRLVHGEPAAHHALAAVISEASGGQVRCWV
ncbi:MBL fold metallo-hydrolase RNA specificity domain-containing protein [Pseudothauera rhizosphaerae]|uniref:MBL fold metallo-hydrolase RNA specificity domain-containing protein n=1 Tax=Pseudothauera rhizosphaerae TaxID=2565932 RepID=UPI001E566D1D|nr:MBL fold metallo-hydrolase RNA specificity domain-containing protein [Pseudothauera rhizosphaerae]